MNVNPMAQLKKFSGETLLQEVEKGGERKPLILKDVVIHALTNLLPNEQISGEDKFKCYLLAKKIYSDGVVSITIDEASLIKSRVDKFFGPLVLGQVYEILEDSAIKGV